MIKGLIFDMDGTMVDNMMVHHRTWQRKLASLGIAMSLEEVKEQIHGINEEILERLFPGRFTPEDRRRVSAEKEAEYRQGFAQSLAPVEGLLTFLEDARAKGISCAVGTAAPPENVNFVLDGLPLRKYFSAVVHAHHVRRGKPDPETFLKAAEQLGLPIGQCLVFEDSVTGARTAYHAGCQAVIITTTHHREEFSEFKHILCFIQDFSQISVEEILTRCR